MEESVVDLVVMYLFVGKSRVLLVILMVAPAFQTLIQAIIKTSILVTSAQEIKPNEIFTCYHSFILWS